MPTSSRISEQPEDLSGATRTGRGHDADGSAATGQAAVSAMPAIDVPARADGNPPAGRSEAAPAESEGTGSPQAIRRPPRTRRRGAMILGAVAVLAGLGAIGWMWQQSLMPDTYSVMDMGVPDFGGGPGAPAAGTAGHHHGDRSTDLSTPPAPAVTVSDLTGPAAGTPDLRVTFVARQQEVMLADGRVIDGFTLNGVTPGPTLRARPGDLVQVTVVNDSVPEGVTLHWHGVDVPNAEDGVAGVTQDAVGVGTRHVYRFVAADAGTYWYHSHNVAHRQVVGGMFGVLVVDPRAGDPGSPTGQDAPPEAKIGRRGEPAHLDRGDQPGDRVDGPGAPSDIVATVHAYDTVLTVNGRAGTTRVASTPGGSVRLRVVNTDNGPLQVAPLDAPFQVMAIDGRDLHEPPPVRNQHLRVPAGGRADLLLELPRDGSAVRVQFGGDPRTALILGPDTAPEPPAAQAPADTVDLLAYGSPAPLGFDPSSADRRFRYDIGRRPGFVDGRPGLFWTINGRLFPDVPMFMVAEGDVVVMTLSNSSGEVHPMHLHGHHAVVLSRNGVPASGSPWWVDSLDVGDGETYEIAFLADNPGVWMDHCHNLPHAAEGLVAHLMYEGVTTPYLVGGNAGNRPE